MFKTSDYFFLAAALIAFGLANYLLVSGFKAEALFVSLWVPMNIVLGMYFKNIGSEPPME
jgi:hypothetical protein